MTTAYEFASLAMQHFIYAGILAAIFAFVTLAYLLLMWRVAGSVSRWAFFVAHTIYLLWQTNIAFVAVVSLRAGGHHRERAGDLMGGWDMAPLVVPGAVVLYLSIITLSVLLIWMRRVSTARPLTPAQRGAAS